MPFGRGRRRGRVSTDRLFGYFPTGRRSVNIVPISDAEIPPHKLTFLHLISTLAVPSSIARSERPDERLYQTNLDRAIKERLPIAVLVFYNLGEESLGGDERAVLKAVKGLSPTSITEWFREFAKISLEELTRWN